jgi:phage shock protein A
LAVARARRATTKTEIRAKLAGLDESGPLEDFERMEHTVDEMEARAAALGEMESDSVERRFARLATGLQVERDLAALKAKKAFAPAGERALTAG